MGKLNYFAENFMDLLRVKGKREPDFDTLLKICFCLDVDPAEILGYQKAKSILEDIKRTK